MNGAPCAETLLRDGDLLEVGRTLLWYREAAPREGRDDVDTRRLDAAAPGLATIAPSMSAAVACLPAIARTALPAVVVGESGTGKELIARALHVLSGRPGPFLAVNCAAIAQTLLESELFGSRRGAFSGATEDRPGLFSLIPSGRFRADLLARLDAFTVELPPLRERREDLGLLAGALLRKLAPDRCERLRFEADAARALFRYSWPLNVRELELSLATALALCGNGPIEAAHLPDPVRRGHPPPAQAGGAGGGHREELVALLHQHAGNVAEVARMLGKGRMQIHRWARRYEIDLGSFRR